MLHKPKKYSLAHIQDDGIVLPIDAIGEVDALYKALKILGWQITEQNEKPQQVLLRLDIAASKTF